MRKRLSILLMALFILPFSAHAQLDAIIDIIVDAVEPTPVYDKDLRRATEDLAGKIDRLNNVLFGGAEMTSAAYRYRTMYSDLYDLTTSFSSYVSHSYNNAKRLETMYTSLDGGSVGSYARNIQQTWYIYDDTVRGAARIIDKFKKIFGDSNMTNTEVRQAAKEALEELNEAQLKEDKRVQEEIEAARIATGLTQCSDFMGISSKDFVSTGKATYGTTVGDSKSASQTGTLGTVVMIIIGLLLVISTLFAGIHIMKGSSQAESTIARLVIVYVVSLVVILAVQGSI